MCILRGGVQKRSPRYAVITHAAVLFAMGLLIVKAALTHVCTLHPLSLSIAPRAPCHSRDGPALPSRAQVHNTNHPHPFLPTTTRVSVPQPPQPYSAHSPHQHGPLKRNKITLKRQNGPTLPSLLKLLTGLSRGPQRRVQLEMMTEEITSQVVVLHVVTARLGPCLSIQLFRSIAELTDSHARHVKKR